MNIVLVVLFNLSAFIFGVFTIWKLFRARDYDEDKALDLVFLGLIVGFLAGRGAYVALNWASYRSYLVGVLNFSDGGFNLEAVVFAFLLVSAYFLFLNKWPFFPAFDILGLGGVVSLIILSVEEILMEINAASPALDYYANFLLKFLILGLAAFVFRKYYRTGGVIALFLVSTFKPSLVLTGALIFVTVNARELAGDFKAGFMQGIQDKMPNVKGKDLN